MAIASRAFSLTLSGCCRHSWPCTPACRCWIAWGGGSFDGQRFEQGEPVTFVVPPGTITLTLYEWIDEKTEPRQEARVISVAAGGEQEIVFGK